MTQQHSVKVTDTTTDNSFALTPEQIARMNANKKGSAEFKILSKARQSIVKAQNQMGFGAGSGVGAADHAIENERLKTTLLVLQQKLKVQDDSDL